MNRQRGARRPGADTLPKPDLRISVPFQRRVQTPPMDGEKVGLAVSASLRHDMEKVPVMSSDPESLSVASPPPSLHRRPWWWLVVAGVVLLGMSMALLAGARSRAPPSPHTSMPQPDQGIDLTAECRAILREIDEMSAEGVRSASYETVPVHKLKALSVAGGTGGVFLIDQRVIYKRGFWEVMPADDDPELSTFATEVAFAQRHVPRLIANFSMHLSATLIARSVRDGFQLAMVPAVGVGGFTKDDLSDRRALAVVQAVAQLHAAFWGIRVGELDGIPEHVRRFQPRPVLSKAGCLWHRARLAAVAIQLRLDADPAQTVLHGDLHAGNYLVSRPPRRTGKELIASLIDFGLAGRGTPMIDLADLFIHAGIDACEERELRLLRRYHGYLRDYLRERGLGDQVPDFASLLDTYSLAYVAFGKRLRGARSKLRDELLWFHESEDGNLERRTRAVLDSIDGGRALANESEYIEAVFRRYPTPGYEPPTDVYSDIWPELKPAQPMEGC